MNKKLLFFFFALLSIQKISAQCNPNPATSYWGSIGITNVKLIGEAHTIDNPSPVPSGGTDVPVESYTITVPPADLMIEKTYTLSVNLESQLESPGNYSGYDNPPYSLPWVKAWIDFSGDGDFNDPHEDLGIFAHMTSPGISSFAFTIPTDININSVPRLMRIMTDAVYYMDNEGFIPDPCGWHNAGETEDYLVNLIPSNVPMFYAESAVTQNIDNIYLDSPNNEIIGIEVTTHGGLSPLTLNNFVFNFPGNLADISNAKVLCTGTSSTFTSTATQLGINIAPASTFTVSGTYPLSTGKNYFWLCYDVPPNASQGHTLDASCTSLMIGTNLYTPSPNNPPGSRTITDPVVSTNCIQSSTPYVYEGTAKNPIIRIQVSAADTFTNKHLDFPFIFKGNSLSDVTDFQLWYSGSATNMNSAILLGTAAPASTFTISSTINMVRENYFWLTAKIDTCAVIDNTIDFTCSPFNFGRLTYSLSPSEPIGHQSISTPYVSSTCTQHNTSLTFPNADNAEILGIEVINSAAAPLITSDFVFIYEGDFLDVSRAKVWSSGTTPAFSTSMQQVGTAIDPATTFTVSGTYTLSPGVNYFWLTFDIPNSAIQGHTIDASCSRITIVSSCIRNYVPEVTDPDGSRTIGPGMVFTSARVTQNNAKVGLGTLNNKIIGLEIVTTGAGNPLSLKKIDFSTIGSNDVLHDIANARVFATGNVSTFLTTSTPLNSTVSPNGNFSFPVDQQLVEGTNYFWLVYDLPFTATVGDTLDATCNSITIGTTTVTPANSAPAGNILIEATCIVTNTINNAVDTILGSLRYCIQEAEAAAAISGSGHVVFNIPAGPLPYTINIGPNLMTHYFPPPAPPNYQVPSELPSIKSITIDATTQPGWTPGSPVVQIKNTKSGLSHEGFIFPALQIDSNSTIRGLIITGFFPITQQGQIAIKGSGSTLAGNFIGVGLGGTSKIPGSGVFMENASNNTIGGPNGVYDRNIICANPQPGGPGETSIALRSNAGPCNNNYILGNYIGLDKNGTAFLNSKDVGIGLIHFDGTHYDISGTVIGGNNAWERNIISGLYIGIQVYHALHTKILSNYIGLDANGINIIKNKNYGIDISGNSDDIVISGNVISGTYNNDGFPFSGAGIELNTSTNCLITGNLIGTDTYGIAALPNYEGIDISGVCSNISIGGTN